MLRYTDPRFFRTVPRNRCPNCWRAFGPFTLQLGSMSNPFVRRAKLV